MVTRDAQHRCAFSLVELMVAVGIISILVALGLPRYQAFIARGRMAEAKVNLGHIASLQGIYRAEWNKYASLSVVGRDSKATYKCDDTAFGNSLGFAPDGCKDLRYGYQSSGGDNFNANAEAGTNVEIYPGCTAKRDKWSVSNTELKVKQDENVVKHCE